MKAIKVVLPILVLAVISGGLFIFKDDIVSYFINSKVYKRENITYAANKYYRILDVNYVDETEDFEPNSKQDVLDIMYTVLNAGLDEFKFYCSESYTDCIEDVKSITEDETILTNINNFVHPYNSYSKMYVTVNNLGEVNINIDHLYSKDDIDIIEENVNEVINKLITPKMSTETKIKTIHDYIINNTKYDSKRSENLEDTTNISHKANGLLTTGYAICGGYADTMAIFLSKLGITNYKISSVEHVWNYVYYDGEWKHLDLTWDDPVTNTGQDIITYDYFLVTEKELISKDSTQHNFDKTVYE